MPISSDEYTHCVDLLAIVPPQGCEAILIEILQPKRTVSGWLSPAQLSKRPGSVWNCLWGNDLLGSFVRVGYRIPVPDFYL